MRNAKYEVRRIVLQGVFVKSNNLSERLLSFSVMIGAIVDSLPRTRMGNHIANQLVRCGTSPSPNYEEACGAESKKDFIHKLRICLKELRETRIWLRLIAKASLLPASKMDAVIRESEELCNIIGKSIATASGVQKTRQP